MDDKFANRGEKVRIILALRESFFLQATARNINTGMERNLLVLISKNCSIRIREDLSFVLFIGTILFSNILLTTFPIVLIVPLIKGDIILKGEVVVSVDPILRRNTDWLTIARL